jgi:hypothetical protein
VPSESHADIDEWMRRVFFGGADLDVPPPLGTTDRSRYVKVRSLGDLEQADLQGWIENTGRVPGWT